ncbi:hypothetical protein [Breoghania sp.]|uniref:hypothetical protein n=1 Tax=Breoghania sp. TaxID=2065378 RepID=UPI002AA66683|nr:hypothetical protein [Breoghania sp.]
MKDKHPKFGKSQAPGAPDGKRPGLRSRGFLSHGGAPAGEGEDVPSRARASRSHDRVGETKPRELAIRKVVRPYRLGED